jgi:hypothetical protein
LKDRLEALEPGDQVLLAPVGAAFQLTRLANPEIVLQDAAKDTKHGTDTGKYLAALVLYSTMFHDAPPPVTPGVKVPEDTPASCRRRRWTRSTPRDPPGRRRRSRLRRTARDRGVSPGKPGAKYLQGTGSAKIERYSRSHQRLSFVFDLPGSPQYTVHLQPRLMRISPAQRGPDDRAGLGSCVCSPSTRT